jgi:hypothetical protein
MVYGPVDYHSLAGRRLWIGGSPIGTRPEHSPVLELWNLPLLLDHSLGTVSRQRGFQSGFETLTLIMT